MALELLTNQRDLLSDLGLNWFHTDSRQGGKSLDLVGDFSTKRNFGVLGKVWVETKAFGKLKFKQRAGKARTTLRDEFSDLKKKDPRFGAVLLLAAECEVLGSQWGPLTLKPELLSSVDGDWQQLTGKRKAARGQVQVTPPFVKLWSRLEKHTTAEGSEKVRLLKDFLRLLEKPTANTVQKLGTYNRLLYLSGSVERLVQERVVEKSGKAPVVGTKRVFQALYRVL